MEMPPSPAMRCSPGRELRADTHKRGNSFESGLIFRDKDEDLALFNEMQTKESDNFLLKSTDDFEDSFSTKLRYFSDYKLGISVPVRGESSDLLNADGEKNDYDWLLTPPDTPLFPSLDDEHETPPVNIVQRGRPRSQPISISRSSTMEKSYRSSRGSASPHRLSPSPRSGISTIQSRGRQSSAPHSSPTSSVRHASPSPSRRPSPSPSKPSTPAPRSSTPTPRRLSTGSSSTASSSRVRGTSPVTTSRGNSASPKVRAWQSNIPGFSSDVPPNLRTSLADRPASYVRGSSPASRNGRESSSKFSRQSMSPTACRSVSSSYSHDRDRFSSSKGSVASSGDADLDSLQSATVSSADRSTPRKVGAFSNSRALASSKKPGRIISSSSAPKRSFDYAMRQMDHRKTPQNMFRPLLSSVPSTTFYAGNASSGHRTMISRNSSVTTSSNTSSDQGTGVAIGTEGSDHNQDDVASEYGKEPYPDVQDDVFIFDRMDVLNEDNRHDLLDGSQNIGNDDTDESPAFKSDHRESGIFSNLDAATAISAASEALHVEVNFPEVDSLEVTLLCSKCGCRYQATEQVETDVKLCPDCSRDDEILTVTTPVTTRGDTGTSSIISIKNSEDDEPSDGLNAMLAAPKLLEGDMLEPRVSKHEENVEQINTCFGEQSQSDSLDSLHSRPLVEEGEQRLVNQQETGQPTVGRNLLNSDFGQQIKHSNDSPASKVDLSEGAGISVLLLQRSSSSKGPVVQGRTFTASAISYDDLRYARDSTNSMRSSIGHGSTSASSSVDWSSCRQTDTRVQRQLSGKKSDMENYRFDTNTKPQSTGSSCSGTSNHSYQVLGPATSAHEGNFEVSPGNMQDVVEEAPACQNQVPSSENKDINYIYTASTETAILEEDNSESIESCRIMDDSTSELSNHAENSQLKDNSRASFPSNGDCVSYENGENFQCNARSNQDIEASVLSPESYLAEEHTMTNTNVDRVDLSAIATHNSLVPISEIEIEDACQDSHGSEADTVCSNSNNNVDDIWESSADTSSDKELTASVPEPSTSNCAHGILEESTVLVEGHKGSKARSLTLEEATDTILFCSSIVHNLAIQAATIAMAKEDSIPLEGSRPTVAILEKPSSDRKNPRGRSAGKHSLKSQKTRPKRLETETKPASIKTETDEKTDEPLVRNVGLPYKADNMRPPKLESKCNCTIM